MTVRTRADDLNIGLKPDISSVEQWNAQIMLKQRLILSETIRFNTPGWRLSSRSHHNVSISEWCSVPETGMIHRISKAAWNSMITAALVDYSPKNPTTCDEPNKINSFQEEAN